MFDRRQQPSRAAPGGALGLRTMLQIPGISQYHHRSSWDHNKCSDPDCLSLAVEFCWGMSRCQLSHSAGTTPLHSQQSSPFNAGGSEPAVNHVPVSYHWTINSGLNITQAQSPQIIAHGTVRSSKPGLKKNCQILPTQKFPSVFLLL